uniref:Uncharacterized protein n=1 Tax=Parascaris equorum TaxID=6256 RepID=A0A914RNM9_PAREQ
MMQRGLISESDPLAGAVVDDDATVDDDGKKELSSPKSIVEEIAKNGLQVISDWHNEILKEPPKFDAFLEEINSPKNRYPNVILYDRSPGQRANAAIRIPLIHYKKWVDDSVIPDNLLE